jgi:8-oxo-dGTP pyrophosphatase MutT (NUDIX family)
MAAAERGGQQRIPRPATFRVGGPPPWTGLSSEARRLSLADVRDRLADLPPARPPAYASPSARAAAVLVALFEEDGEARLILTKRPDTMPSHQGEIAFPGGKVDPALDVDARAAALREAHEEIGLDPAIVEVVAELDAIGTVASRFTIRPFVGLLPARPVLQRDRREVVAIFDVALSELLADEAYREEQWDGRAPSPGSDFALSVHFFELPGETVWGATARILTSLLTDLTRS